MEKIIGIWKHAGKVGKNQLLTTSDLEDKEDYYWILDDTWLNLFFTAFYYHDIMVMSRVGFIFALSIFRWFMISKKSYYFYTENFRNAF